MQNGWVECYFLFFLFFFVFVRLSVGVGRCKGKRAFLIRAGVAGVA